jgi:hypothetical protein
MRLLSGMDDFVSTEGGRLSECLATYFAHEGSGAGVNWHMASQIVVRPEQLATHLTMELRPDGVSSFVDVDKFG